MTARFQGQRSRSLLLLCTLVLLALGLDLWQSVAQRAGNQTWFDNAVTTISCPLQRALLSATWRTEKAWKTIAYGRQLTQENARLAAEVAALEAQLTRLQEARAASQREHALLSAYADTGRSARVAHVIAVGSGGWLSYLVVDRGAAHGVRVQDIAVAREGLVGQVYAVAARTARILPITDPTSGVAVRLQRSRETGILKGLGHWRCEIRYLSPDADVQPGDQVLTTGSGGVFPPGLRVGTVTAVMANRYTPGRVAPVALVVQLHKVEEILLLPGRNHLQSN